MVVNNHLVAYNHCYNHLIQIRNKETSQCLDSMGRKAGEKVGMVGCHGMGGNQVSTYSNISILSYVYQYLYA